MKRIIHICLISCHIQPGHKLKPMNTGITCVIFILAIHPIIQYYVDRTGNSLNEISPSYFDLNDDGSLKLTAAGSDEL